MNKGLKILTGTLAAVVGAGAVGTACYYNVPSFKSKVNSALNIGKKTAEIKSGETIDNPNEVKPISPEQFKTQYKVDLPTSFLGGQLFVKQLSNNNLLISSDIATGLLMYDVATDNVSKIELAYSGFKYFTEYDDLILFSSTTVSFFLNKEDYSCKQLSIPVFNSYRLNTGNFILFSNRGFYFINFLTLKLEEVVVTSNSNTVISNYPSCIPDLSVIDLGNDRVLLSFIYGNSFPGLYYYDNVTMSVAEKVYSGGFDFVRLYEDDKQVILGSYSLGIFSFNKNDLSVELINSTVFYGVSYVYIQDTICCIFSAKGVYVYDVDKNECSAITFPQNFASVKVLSFSLENNNKLFLCYNSYGCYVLLWDAESSTLNLLNTLCSVLPEFVSFTNGDILIYGSKLGYKASDSYVKGVFSVFYFSNSDNTLKQLWSSYYADSIALDNGQLLFASYCRDNWSLYQFNPEDQSYKMVLKLDDFDSFEKQEDGTILINTGTGIDYEYDQLYESFRLVYNAN